MRKFKCVSLEEINVKYWSSEFKVGSVYDLIEDDSEMDLTLRLKDEYGYKKWVDCQCFEEVIDPI